MHVIMIIKLLSENASCVDPLRKIMEEDIITWSYHLGTTVSSKSSVSSDFGSSMLLFVRGSNFFLCFFPIISKLADSKMYATF